MPIHLQVLDIFRQVLAGFRSVQFTLSSGMVISGFDALVGIAVLVIGCKICWSTFFEKRVGLVSNSANFEKDAMRLAQYNMKKQEQDIYNRRVAIYANNLQQEAEAKRDISDYKRKVFKDNIKHFIYHKEV